MGRSSDIAIRTKRDNALDEAEKALFIGGGYNFGCSTEECQQYGQEMEKLYWEDMPIDPEIVKSHKAWVDNRRQWSGTSKYLQESIEPSVNWIGIKPGGIGPPEPVPQSCNNTQLTEYGPADFSVFVTQERRRCGNPVLNPAEMANEGARPYCMYGF